MFLTKLRLVTIQAVCVAACVACAAAFVSTTAGQDAPKTAENKKAAEKRSPQDVLKTLEGTWALKSYTTDGETKSGDEEGTTFRGQRLTIKGNHWVERYAFTPEDTADKDLVKSEFKINIDASPPRIDSWVVNRPGKQKRLGIFKLEGDTLTICFRIERFTDDELKKAKESGVLPDEHAPRVKTDRPGQFEAKKGQEAGLAVFERVKAADKQPGSPVAPGGARKKDNPVPPLNPNSQPPASTQYRALIEEYDTATRDFLRELVKLKTKPEQQKFAQEKAPREDDYAARFMAIAENHPQDAVAVDCLIWVVRNNYDSASAGQALKRLTADHIRSKKLTDLLPILIDEGSPASEEMLRTALKNSPHKEVQGQACFALAQLVSRQSDNAAKLKQQPEWAKQLEASFGKD